MPGKQIDRQIEQKHRHHAEIHIIMPVIIRAVPNIISPACCAGVQIVGVVQRHQSGVRLHFQRHMTVRQAFGQQLILQAGIAAGIAFPADQTAALLVQPANTQMPAHRRCIGQAEKQHRYAAAHGTAQPFLCRGAVQILGLPQGRARAQCKAQPRQQHKAQQAHRRKCKWARHIGRDAAHLRLLPGGNFQRKLQQLTVQMQVITAACLVLLAHLPQAVHGQHTVRECGVPAAYLRRNRTAAAFGITDQQVFRFYPKPAYRQLGVGIVPLHSILRRQQRHGLIAPAGPVVYLKGHKLQKQAAQHKGGCRQHPGLFAGAASAQHKAGLHRCQKPGPQRKGRCRLQQIAGRKAARQKGQHQANCPQRPQCTAQKAPCLHTALGFFQPPARSAAKHCRQQKHDQQKHEHSSCLGRLPPKDTISILLSKIL